MTTRSIPCLTVWQPWASLIAIGAKPFEFRRWRAPSCYVGATIGIHAGARSMRMHEVMRLLAHLKGPEAGRGTALRPHLAVPMLEAVMREPGILPLGAIICTAVLARPRRATALAGAEGGDSERADHHVFAWPLFKVRPLEPVQPARGSQGFWRHEVALAVEQAA